MATSTPLLLRAMVSFYLKIGHGYSVVYFDSDEHGAASSRRGLQQVLPVQLPTMRAVLRDSSGTCSEPASARDRAGKHSHWPADWER
jgi:hypothetical protein